MARARVLSCGSSITSASQQQRDFVAVHQHFELVAPVCALESKELLIPLRTRRDVSDDDHRIAFHRTFLRRLRRNAIPAKRAIVSNPPELDDCGRPGPGSCTTMNVSSQCTIQVPASIPKAASKA